MIALRKACRYSLPKNDIFLSVTCMFVVYADILLNMLLEMYLRSETILFQFYPTIPQIIILHDATKKLYGCRAHRLFNVPENFNAFYLLN